MSDTTTSSYLNNLFSLQTQYDKILNKYNFTVREYQNELKTLRNNNELYNRVQNYLSTLGDTDAINELQTTDTSTSTVDMKPSSYLDSLYESDITDILAELRDQEGLLVLQQGRAFWGSSEIGDEFVADATECLDLCNTIDECSGATFKGNENGGLCYIREGPGQIQPNVDSTAIVSKLQVFLSMIYEYNKQLTDLNNQIQDAVAAEPSTNQNAVELGNSIANETLEQRSAELTKQREVINELFQQYDTNRFGLNDTKLTVTQRFYQYRIWIILLIISILVSIYFIYGISGLYIIFPILFIFSTWFLGFSYLTFLILVISLFYLLYKYIPTM